MASVNGCLSFLSRDYKCKYLLVSTRGMRLHIQQAVGHSEILLMAYKSQAIGVCNLAIQMFRLTYLVLPGPSPSIPIQALSPSPSLAPTPSADLLHYIGHGLPTHQCSVPLLLILLSILASSCTNRGSSMSALMSVPCTFACWINSHTLSVSRHSVTQLRQSATLLSDPFMYFIIMLNPANATTQWWPVASRLSAKS